VSDSLDPWSEKAKRILRSEMIRQGFTYDQLAQRLGEMGEAETAANLRNKMSRGRFTAAFFLQCLSALGRDQLRID
jgi:hypothetical protein